MRDYCDRVDAYHAEVAEWSKANPDDMDAPITFDAPWCPLTV